MKTRLLTIMITLVFVIAGASPAAYATDDSVAAALEDKSVYHTAAEDYIDGDCVLTSTRMMIRRLAIMQDSDAWQNITNASLRPTATEYGLMHSNFSFENDGITYKVSNAEFKGEDTAARVKEFSELLEEHPEGIVVYGPYAAETGSHGVLVVKCSGNEVYAVDSAINTGDLNEGIQKWEDTIMLDPSLCTDYWYISKTSGEVKTPKVQKTPRFFVMGKEIKYA